MGIMATFTTYHIAKYFLWNRGYCAHFFYRTRLMSIPVLFVGLWYSTCKAYPRDLKTAGILDYSKKRVNFERDMGKLKQFMKLRQDYFTEHSKEQIASVSINQLINKK